MKEENGYHVPPPLAFSSAFGNYEELHLSPNGSNGCHGLALSSWPIVNSQQITHYDETTQYFPDSGCASVAGIQAVTAVSDLQENLKVDPRCTSMEKFTCSSFPTELLNVNMQDDCQYQDLASRAGLLCFGQFEKMKDECQTSCFVRDLGMTTAVPSLESYVLAQDHTCNTQEVNGKDYVIQSLEPSKPASSLDSKQYRKLAREELNARDYDRRFRASKGIQDLEKLLPHSAKNQWEIINKSIEYVKNLQLQLKELSQNSLVFETESDPFNSLKGFGFHYRPQMSPEELKDTFGQLLEENPAAAMKLLESRGLLKVSLDLVKALPRTE